MEEMVADELREMGIDFIPEAAIGNQSLDFLLPQLTVAIEVDSRFWHSSARAKAQDARKDRALERAGVALIRLDAEGDLDAVKACLLRELVQLQLRGAKSSEPRELIERLSAMTSR